MAEKALLVLDEAEAKARLTPTACEPGGNPVQVGEVKVVTVDLEEAVKRATRVVGDSVRCYQQ